jgi:hypothetical protein
MISLETKDGCTFFRVTGNVTANENYPAGGAIHGR